jgi:hypothetical protein
MHLVENFQKFYCGILKEECGRFNNSFFDNCFDLVQQLKKMLFLEPAWAVFKYCGTKTVPLKI